MGFFFPSRATRELHKTRRQLSQRGNTLNLRLPLAALPGGYRLYKSRYNNSCFADFSNHVDLLAVVSEENSVLTRVYAHNAIHPVKPTFNSDGTAKITKQQMGIVFLLNGQFPFRCFTGPVQFLSNVINMLYGVCLNLYGLPLESFLPPPQFKMCCAVL